MTKDLVIVESPAKARTLGRFLGDAYQVKASLGHVRDLPKSQLGVDIAKDFTPKYLIPQDKRRILKELNEAVKAASAIYLATDPDREGEAISWHLTQATAMEGKTVRRVAFHEITQEAVREAFRHPRELNMQLVNAQQARRILDRLVGYKISPLLWRKIKRGLSAGRVQSVAVRLIVDREREIQGFIPVEYWSIEAELCQKGAQQKRRGPPEADRARPKGFRASLVSVLGESAKLEIPDEATAKRLVAELEGATYTVAEIRQREVFRQPAPPFTTSTLQQEAWRKLRASAQRTMRVAQQLYEGLPLGSEGSVGLITYMRTDSTQVAASAQGEARAYIAERYGQAYLPPTPRQYRTKTPAAQEAHEAIRPTSVRREPEAVRSFLNADQFRLYDLIWKRFLASQMAAALFENTTVDIIAASPETAERGRSYLLRASGSVQKFPGFLALYREGRDDEEEGEASARREAESPLPPLTVGEVLVLLGLFPEQHFTQPPPRYTEATLIKALEESGIGRPSTYAPILATIQERGYVHQVERRFRPTELGLIVNDLLVEHFPRIVDIKFTADLEEKLDQIARGQVGWVPVLQRFYTPFEETVEQAFQRIEKVVLPQELTEERCEQCGRPLAIKMGRYGRFLACTGFPQCRNAKPLLQRIGVACPRCGGDLVQRETRPSGRGARRRRTFYGCAHYPACDFTSWERPVPGACPQCGGLRTLLARQRPPSRDESGRPAGELARCTGCGATSPYEAQPEPVLVGA